MTNRKAVNMKMSFMEYIEQIGKEQASIFNDIYFDSYYLLNDYQFVYDNIESIITCKTLHWEKMNFEQYYNIFKALTDKYPNDMYKDKNLLKDSYCELLIYIMQQIEEAPIDIQKQFVSDDYFQDFLLKYGKNVLTIKNVPVLSNLNTYDFYMHLKLFQSKLLMQKYSEFIYLLKLSHYKKELTSEFLQRPDILRKLTHTCNYDLLQDFLKTIDYELDTTAIRQEHNLFCDHLINYLSKSNDDYLENKQIKNFFSTMKVDLPLKIKNNEQDLIKYLIVCTIVSRHFETEPYNFLMDLRTLTEYVLDEDRDIKYNFPNMNIYTKLVNPTKYSIQELIDLYHFMKDKDISAQLYDDWNLAKKEFVEELNEKIINRNNMPLKDEKLSRKYGVDIYRIDSQKSYYIIIHNTSISINDQNSIDLMIKQNGLFGRSCLSVQDENHLRFFEEYTNAQPLILIFDNLDDRFLTYIYPSDAFSTSLYESEEGTPRKIFPLKKLMKYTGFYDFNELTYYTDTKYENGIDAKSPLKPFAILCEDLITKDFVTAAKKMHVPIIFRSTFKKPKKTDDMIDYYEGIQKYKSFR